MKKVAVGLFFTILAVLTIQPVQAVDVKTLAIIDTAVDSSKIPQVVYEACFTDSKQMACPNKETFMEGKGAASSPVWPTSMLNPVYHGFNVTKAALATNPNIKIVFVRISDITQSGGSINSPKSLTRAIEWVSNNALRMNINAVSISQSGISAGNLNACTTDTVTINAIANLNKQNVPVFAATGNDGKNLVGFPACVSGVTGVGALGSLSKTKTFSSYTEILKSTNFGIGLDVVSRGEIDVVRFNGSVASFTATSAATPIAAATYLSVNKFNTLNDYVAQLVKVKGYPYITN